MYKRLTPNGEGFRSVQEMTGSRKAYIAGGCVKTELLEKVLPRALVGATRIGSVELACLLFGTMGRSAITTVLRVLGACGHVVAARDIFGGTAEFLRDILPRYGGEVSFVGDVNDRAQLTTALRPETRVVFCESISSAGLRFADLQMIAPLVREMTSQALIVVDETLSTGLRCKDGTLFSPLNFGVDIVVGSMSNYLCGKNDERGGYAMMLNPTAPNWLLSPGQSSSTTVAELIRAVQRLEGTVMHPEVANRYVMLVSDLDKRMPRHSQAAINFAEGLGDDIAIYPGMDTYPDHDLVRMHGLGYETGGIVTFRAGGDFQTARKLADSMARTGVGTIANSFGDEETYIAPLYALTGTSKETFQFMGVPEDLIRVSLGHGVTTRRAWAAGERTRALIKRG